MNETPFISDPISLQQLIKDLKQRRKNGKLKIKRTYNLTPVARKAIHEKTAGKCHICGCDVSLNKFHADHVQSFIHAGANNISNFLPACEVCNRAKWHHLPEEVQWIMKIGQWVQSEIRKGTTCGKLVAEGFVKTQVNNKKRKPLQLAQI